MLDDDPFAKSKLQLNLAAERLEDLSIRELHERISDLEAQIKEIRALIEAKESSKQVADTFFKKGTP
ncbi:DUF1192 domain-containing protein [Candidatus Phycosocius spiralis]|uniref:DUF1192 domain-containing protein n=1 Tax=Candidatus Phycosocius spiralis TaxID=2815099 RepID=A0ABQ4PVN3_9PROT|nr:DUF1192 domain-containing protein [Candidatus Phycosocius spiralis]GIU67058.1 hypothetical protein PsB1_1212 [Candidatus Phycosocius spiralis]